jgi:DNA-binding MarR family transcriptional regulator
MINATISFDNRASPAAEASSALASSPADAELAILESIYESQRRERALTQRELAESAGLSLGMTNALLKRFADKGWVMLRRLSARHIQYALSPEGVAEIARRSYRYFRRTARSAAMYRDILEAFAMRVKRGGAERVVLAGASDLDFILEYACERHGLTFVKGADPAKAARLAADPSTVLIEAEGDDPSAPPLPGAKRLAEVLVGA